MTQLSKRRFRSFLLILILLTVIAIYYFSNPAGFLRLPASFFNPLVPLSQIDYDLTIIEDHPCANVPHKFLFAIENKSTFTIESFGWSTFFKRGQMSWQKEGRAVFDSGPVTFSSFIDLQSDKCWTSIPFIPSGGKGGILVTLPEWIPGQVEVETAVYVCLRDGLKSCRTEILPYVTKTPLYDLTAVSDFWIQFQGVYPCNYPFEGVMAAFSYQNRGETSLQLSRSKITLLDENNQLVQRQSPYVRLDNPTKWCGADQPPALSGEESMLLIIWKEPTTPPVGTLVQATVTFCPVQTRFIDLDCPSREYEFYISK